MYSSTLIDCSIYMYLRSDNSFRFYTQANNLIVKLRTLYDSLSLFSVIQACKSATLIREKKSIKPGKLLNSPYCVSHVIKCTWLSCWCHFVELLINELWMTQKKNDFLKFSNNTFLLNNYCNKFYVKLKN